MKVTVGILNKKQTLALFKTVSKKWKLIKDSDKEFYTDAEVEELMEVRTNPAYTFPPGTVGGNRNGAPGSDAGLAEDDKVHSYDNNFGEWR